MFSWNSCENKCIRSRICWRSLGKSTGIFLLTWALFYTSNGMHLVGGAVAIGIIRWWVIYDFLLLKTLIKIVWVSHQFHRFFKRWKTPRKKHEGKVYPMSFLSISRKLLFFPSWLRSARVARVSLIGWNDRLWDTDELWNTLFSCLSQAFYAFQNCLTTPL